MHWALGAIDFVSREILYFDSMCSRSPTYFFEDVRRFLAGEAALKNQTWEPAAWKDVWDVRQFYLLPRDPLLTLPHPTFRAQRHSKATQLIVAFSPWHIWKV